MGDRASTAAARTLERLRALGARFDGASLADGSWRPIAPGAASRTLMDELARSWSASPDPAIRARRHAELAAGLRLGYSTCYRVLGDAAPDTMLEAEMLRTRLHDLPVPEVVDAAGEGVRGFGFESALAAWGNAKHAGHRRDRTVEALTTGFWAGFVLALAEGGDVLDA